MGVFEIKQLHVLNSISGNIHHR